MGLAAGSPEGREGPAGPNTETPKERETEGKIPGGKAGGVREGPGGRDSSQRPPQVGQGVLQVTRPGVTRSRGNAMSHTKLDPMFTFLHIHKE